MSWLISWKAPGRADAMVAVGGDGSLSGDDPVVPTQRDDEQIGLIIAELSHHRIGWPGQAVVTLPAIDPGYQSFKRYHRFLSFRAATSAPLQAWSAAGEGDCVAWC
jgi:hypothetical protein